LVLYFASLGAGHVLGPVLAGSMRLAVVIAGGMWLMPNGNGSAQSLFIVVATAMALYGLCTAWVVWRTPWQHRK
ncbi:MAG TPA: MATE family efflux transporter, partial [Comamonas sp.]